MVAVDADLEVAGHSYAIGVNQGNEDGKPSLQLIDIHNCFRAEMTSLELRSNGNVRRGKQIELLFERDRPNHHETLATRLEVRQFHPGTHEPLWSKIQEPKPEAVNVFYFVGRTLDRITNPRRIEKLRHILDANNENRIRLLVSNPRLLKECVDSLDRSRPQSLLRSLRSLVRSPTRDFSNVLRSMLGPPEQLRLDANKAAKSLENSRHSVTNSVRMTKNALRSESTYDHTVRRHRTQSWR